MMTRIYNVCRTATGTLLLTAALTACTDARDLLQQNETPREGKFMSVTATQGNGADTRVTHTPNATTQGVDVKWASGDKIYVGKIPASGSQSVSDGILSPSPSYRAAWAKPPPNLRAR